MVDPHLPVSSRGWEKCQELFVDRPRLVCRPRADIFKDDLPRFHIVGVLCDLGLGQSDATALAHVGVPSPIGKRVTVGVLITFNYPVIIELMIKPKEIVFCCVAFVVLLSADAGVPLGEGAENWPLGGVRLEREYSNVPFLALKVSQSQTK